MRKIPSLFLRDRSTGLVIHEFTKGSEWVGRLKGVATRKYDGTCCLIEDGKLWKRHEVKAGGTIPEGFKAATTLDPATNKIQGWLPVGDGPEDQWHREALSFGYGLNSFVYGDESLDYCALNDGTYELCGPKVNGNPEQCPRHFLIAHGQDVMLEVPRYFDDMPMFFESEDIEGIVFAWKGYRAKVKAKDFGVKRVPTSYYRERLGDD